MIALAACNRGTTTSNNIDQGLPTHELIDGYVWDDSDGDGVFSEAEVGISNYGVVIISFDAEGKEQEFDPDLDVTDTDEFGYFEFERRIGTIFRLNFSPTNANIDREDYQGFTKRDVGSESTDSDVDEDGLTDTYTLSEGFFPTLSAGLLPAEAPDTGTSVSINDPTDDCVAEGQEEKQACEGDIHSCQVAYDPDTGHYSFTCTLGQVTDYSQFDFYVTLNLDGDASRGKTEGQAAGVDAELYLNSQETRIQINRYDAAGNYLRGDVLDPEIVVPILGTDEEHKIGINFSRLVGEVSKLFENETQVSFVLVTYPPSGGQFFDDTAILPESITFTGLE
jgi:hypothetical protein